MGLKDKVSLILSMMFFCVFLVNFLRLFKYYTYNCLRNLFSVVRQETELLLVKDILLDKFPNIIPKESDKILLILNEIHTVKINLLVCYFTVLLLDFQVDSRWKIS